MTAPRLDRIAIGDVELATATWGGGPPEIVVLHDGLGSIAQWRSVPGDLASATGRTVMAYDRAGHGTSRPVPSGPWPADWLHREAEVLSELLDVCGAGRPALVGHSDGGTIAAIHAAMPGTEVEALVLLAAHTWIEDIAVAEISSMRTAGARIADTLGRFHDHPRAVFEAWSGVWVSSEFRSWDIRDMLGEITAPTLVIQGDADEYATSAHAVETASAIGTNAECRLIRGGKHLLHHSDPAQLVETIAEFIDGQHSTLS